MSEINDLKDKLLKLQIEKRKLNTLIDEAMSTTDRDRYNELSHVDGIINGQKMKTTQLRDEFVQGFYSTFGVTLRDMNDIIQL